VTLLPGAGFDVVPSDYMAVHVARRLPGARRLRISIGGDLGVSRGTAKTMIEGAAHGTRVRRRGAMTCDEQVQHRARRSRTLTGTRLDPSSQLVCDRPRGDAPAQAETTTASPAGGPRQRLERHDSGLFGRQ
jgi:short subunit dehydrogenase-like uncharacterized protein